MQLQREEMQPTKNYINHIPVLHIRNTHFPKKFNETSSLLKKIFSLFHIINFISIN